MTSRQAPIASAVRAAGFVFPIALLLVATALQWDGHSSLVVADVQSYLVSGVNLIRTGSFVNAFGEAELWFPPLFPALIGLGSLGGFFDPHVTGRLLSVLSSCITLVLVWKIGLDPLRSVMIGAGAAILLACNSLFQQQAVQSMSQPLATMLATSAVWLWLKGRPNVGAGRTMAAGLFVGLGYLVRPEILLLLPLLIGIDHFHRRESLANTVRYRWPAVAMLAMCVIPYATYLSVNTGRLTLSNKGEVNLAAARSQHYGLPREMIEAGTLTMGYASYPITRSSEIGRYFSNVGRIGSKYFEIFRVPLGLAFVLFALGGAVGLIVSPASRRTGLVLLAPFGYLAVLPRYAVEASYLHGTLPSIALFAAAGIVGFYGWAVRLDKARWAIVCLVGGWLMISLLEQATRQPRWALTQELPETLLKEAGTKLREIHPGTGTLIEEGGTISYYSGLRRGRLTPNDLAIVRAYAAKRYEGPVFLALTDILQSSYHPSVAALLDDGAGMLPVVVELSDQRGRVVIFKLN